MNATAFLAIGIGAVLGAWLRYGLGLWLNPVFAAVPLGTLAANLIGGYLIGVAVAVFHINVELSPELRLPPSRPFRPRWCISFRTPAMAGQLAQRACTCSARC
jgi:hypothetical protein